MAKKIALILSGGGGKGAFQYAAEKYAREQKNYRWNLIAGVSVGALNGVMLAQGEYRRLDDIWQNIKQEDVYRGKANWWALMKVFLLKKLAIYDNRPLWELIQREVRKGQMITPLIIGVASLVTGRYYQVTPLAPDFQQMVLASTAIPVAFPPVKRHLVDGGVRNISPLGDVLKHDPDEIVIINCSDPAEMGQASYPKTVLDVGERTVDILTNEIFLSDLREFLTINELVRQAEQKGIQLLRRDGRPYKYFRAVVIQPTEPMGDTLDFSRQTLNRRIAHGWERARAILG